MSFTLAGDFSVHIPDPKVISPSIITVLEDGREIGKVSAEFDFSGLPEKYHEWAISVIEDWRTSLLDRQWPTITAPQETP